MQMYACQWSGVATQTMSIDGSASTSRKSRTILHVPTPWTSSTCFAQPFARTTSQSQTAAMRTFGALCGSRKQGMSVLRIWLPQPIMAIVRFSPGLRARSPVFPVAHPASDAAATEPKMKPRLFMFMASTLYHNPAPRGNAPRAPPRQNTTATFTSLSVSSEFAATSSSSSAPAFVDVVGR